MSFGPFAVGPFNSSPVVVDRTDSLGLFDQNEPDRSVETMARGTRKAADERARTVLSGSEDRGHQVTGMDAPGQPDAVALNPQGTQVIDPNADTVSGATMALNGPVRP